MRTSTSWTNRLCCIGLVASMLVVGGAGPAFADPPGRYYGQGDHRDDRGDKRDERGDKRDDRGDKRDDRGDKRDDRGDKRDDRGDKRDDRGDKRYDRRDKRYDRPVIRDYREDKRDDDRNYWNDRRGPGYRFTPHDRYREQYRGHHKQPRIIYRGKPRIVPRDRVRWYRDVVIVRPHGHWYPGYAHYQRDDDAYKWLAFTAITLGVLDYLNEAQQREHEAAQIAATTAPLGERIIWQEGGARGAVVAVQEGTSTSGRYCREFQHTVAIGGRTEEAYGTACRNPDGSWEVVSVEGQ